MHVAVAALAVLLQTAPPPAVCSVPQPPPVERPEKPVRPATPSCVNEAAGTHTCRPAVVNAYQRDMTAYSQAFNAYVGAVNGYVDALNRYMQSVNDYISCERQIVMPSQIITG